MYARAEPLERFSPGERLVHRTTAILFGVCVATAAVLYISPLAVLVGRRHLVKTVHVGAGLALPVPMLLGWLSASFRADLRRLNRFSARDWEWFRSKDRRSGRIAIGKFNPGQKLNAALTGGAIIVMFATGWVMRFFEPFPVAWRTGATFVHDWLALVFAVLVAGHISFALRDPGAMEGMRSGRVDRSWARHHHPGWAAEMAERETPDEAEAADLAAVAHAPPTWRMPPVERNDGG